MIKCYANQANNTDCLGPYLSGKFPYIANEVNKRLNSSAQKPNTSSTALYRVRKTWSDANSQKGAFKDLSNAKKCADKNKGYYVFDGKGKAVCPKQKKKSVDTIAREVIRGDWGNGDERKRRLTAAGYDYSTVQKRVNELLKY